MITWTDVYDRVGITPADLRLWRLVALYPEPPAPKSKAKPKPARSVLPCDAFRVPNSTVEHPRRRQDQGVWVNGEFRGPDWGRGRAAEMFEALRQEYNKYPPGHYAREEALRARANVDAYLAQKPESGRTKP